MVYVFSERKKHECWDVNLQRFETGEDGLKSLPTLSSSLSKTRFLTISLVSDKSVLDGDEYAEDGVEYDRD